MSKIQVDNHGVGDTTVKGDTKVNTRIKISIGNIIFVSIVLIIAIFIFTNFAKSEHKILGTWLYEDTDSTISFSKDNTVILADEGDVLQGTYTWVGDNKIQLNLSYAWANFSISSDVAIQGDVLTLSNISDPKDAFNADGKTWTLHKSK